MDWAAIALAAKRANAAYETTPDKSKAAFTALGDDWVDLYSTDSMQAALSVDSTGATWLSISGTRASDGYVIDVFRDVSLEPTKVKGGTVTAGALAGMDDLWAWALDTVPDANPIFVSGHSLGHARACLSPLYLAPKRIGRIFGFEGPKFVGADFFQAYAASFANAIFTVQGADAWAAWPWLDWRWQARPPVDHIWLKDNGSFAIIPASQWPGGLKFGDHDIGLVCQRLEAIAAASVKPAA